MSEYKNEKQIIGTKALKQHRRLNLICEHLDPTAKSFLEIGALDTPTLSPDKYRVKFLDWFSRSESTIALKENHAHQVTGLVEVDYVIKSNDFADKISEKFDAIIANHVIEHIPDIVNWFHQIEQLLSPNGFLFLSIPHKEYTFDLERPETTLGQILRSYHNRQEEPDQFQVFDVKWYHRSVRSSVVWRGKVNDKIRNKRISAKEALDFAQCVVSQGYFDCHVNVFTPKSFSLVFEGLSELELIQFNILEMQEVKRPLNEFMVALRKKNVCMSDL